MPNPPPFAIICVYPFGSDLPTPVSTGGKLIVFDHAEQARNYIYFFGNERETVFDAPDAVHWTPMRFKEPNHACIVTEYDPYNAPANWTALAADGARYPVRSETHGIEWRYHIHAGLVFEDIGQIDTDAHGVHTNLALAP